MIEEIFDGGFPLFYIIDTISINPDTTTDEEKKKREFRNIKVIDVHDILAERKKIPFLNILEGFSQKKEDIVFNNINLLSNTKLHKKKYKTKNI